MSRKCKFDPEWVQALGSLSEQDAVKAREMIENYQKTGVVPSGLPVRMEMILLLVKPLIDRRRRATEAARRRRMKKSASMTVSAVAEAVVPLSEDKPMKINAVGQIYVNTPDRRPGARLRW